MLTILIYGLIHGLQISLVALAFQLNFKVLKMFDLSQAGIYIASSYFFILFQSNFGINNIILSLLLALLCTAIVSILISKFIYQPFFKKGTGSISLLIVSLVIYMIIINIIVIFFSPETQIINLKNISYSSFTMNGIILTKIQILQIIVSLFLIVGAFLILDKTKIGKEIIAVSENEQLYSILGYNIFTLRNKVIVFSTILLFFASFLRSSEIGIEPFGTGFNVLLLGIVAVIIGGINSFKGAIFGSLFLGLVLSLSSWFISGQWQEAITFLLLMLTLLIKKDGFYNIKLRLEK